MNHPLGKFLLLSIIIHVVFFQLFGLIIILPESQGAPVRVALIEPEEIEKSERESLAGRVEDIQPPEKKERPDRADILSRADSVAHSPEKGKKHKAQETALPRELILPSPPALAKDKVDQKETRPEKNDARVAALPRPEDYLKRKDAARDIDPFSREKAKKVADPANKRRTIKDKKIREEKNRKLSTAITDLDARPRPEPERPSGAPDVKGSDRASWLRSETGDLIDMGDEAVVSLNTRAFAYVDYFSGIKRAVELVWTYPEEAIIRGFAGKTLVRFTLNRDGELVGVKLVKSSGRKLLDDEALLAIKAAAPYLPFPEGLDKKRLHIIAAFVYEPTYNAVR